MLSPCSPDGSFGAGGGGGGGGSDSNGGFSPADSMGAYDGGYDTTTPSPAVASDHSPYDYPPIDPALQTPGGAAQHHGHHGHHNHYAQSQSRGEGSAHGQYHHSYVHHHHSSSSSSYFPPHSTGAGQRGHDLQ
jgi:hypothetical protein